MHPSYGTVGLAEYQVTYLLHGEYEGCCRAPPEYP